MAALLLTLSTPFSPAAESCQGAKVNQAVGAQSLQFRLNSFIYKLTAYSPSKGNLGEREVAVVARDLRDAEFQVTFIQNA
jgi:hypothetical protein